MPVDLDPKSSNSDPALPSATVLEGPDAEMADVARPDVEEADLFPFLVKATAWAMLVYLTAQEFATSNLWVVILSVFVFSIPIALSGIYSGTITQINRLESFARQGWIFRLLSGRPLKVVVWVCLALVLAFFMLIQFHSYSQLEWLVFFLVIPVFWGSFHVCRRTLAGEYKPYLVTHKALKWSRWICPLLMLIISMIASVVFAEVPIYVSLEAAVTAQQAAVQDMTGSALITQVSQLLATYDGIRAYALQRLGEQDALLMLLAISLGSFVLFFNACAMLSCFLISSREYRRVFGPLSATDDPMPPPLSRIAVTVAITTFLALFIYVPAFAYLEAWVQQTPELARTSQSIQSMVIQNLVQIDDDYFAADTPAQLELARIEALQTVAVSLTALEGQADLAFDQMEMNVDVFLDWYYSLRGEYARLGTLMIGDLEPYMIGKMNESLLQGDAFNQVEQAFNIALREHEDAQRVYQQKVNAILQENRITALGDGFRIVRQMSLSEILRPPIATATEGLEDRLTSTHAGVGLAGALSVLVAQKVVAKVAGKNIFKLAATALSKLVLSKTAGTTAAAAAGAGAGAAVGSIVPGAGTAVGAVIGGIVGAIGIGLTIDKIIIEIEESVNREEFKQEIMSSIQDERADFKSRLRG
jgi:hypothetical protein